MNKIWLSIIIMSLTLLIFTSPEKALPAMMDASANAVNLSIKLLAIYALWLGIIEIVKVTKLGEKLANLLSPLIDFLFGKIDNKAKEYISLNMSFNMLGVGNAATPTALKAIQKLNGNAEIATTASIMLLVLNATSLQIIPTTIIGMKTASLSVNPTNIILPTLIASLLGTILAVILVKICSKFHNNKTQNKSINPLNYYKKIDSISDKSKAINSNAQISINTNVQALNDEALKDKSLKKKLLSFTGRLPFFNNFSNGGINNER